MSQENVEIVQQSFVTWAETGEPTWGFLHDEVEAHDHDIMDGSVYRGREGVERWFADWEAAWSEFRMEPEEFIDAGERVVVFVRMTATGRGSGVTLDRPDAMVIEVRDKKFVRFDYYNDRSEALRAVGLQE